MVTDFLTVIVFFYIFAIAIKGAVRGFYGTVIATFLLIALFILTIVLSPKTYNLIKDSQNVNAYMEERAWDIVGAETEKIAAGTDYSLLQYIPVSDELGAALMNGDADAIRQGAVQIYLKNAVKELLIYAAAVIFTVIFCVVILVIAAIVVHGLVETPGIRAIDRMMGFVLGLLEGLIGIWVLLAILHLFEFSEAGGAVLAHVQASPVLSMLDDYNLVYLAERYVMGMKLWG